MLESDPQHAVAIGGNQTDSGAAEAPHQNSVGIGGHQTGLDSTDACQHGQVHGVHKHQTQRYWQVTAVISCFLANLFFGGVGNSYGVLYIYMQDSLGVSEYQLSWLGALMTGFIGLASIIATVLVETFGCRITTLIGGLLLSSSVIVSSQTSNIYLLYLTLGVLPGTGTILSYLATMVHISRMFSRWLPIATGLSVTGTAVGILIWPSMISGIADIMGWRGTVLIHGAILLHLVPAALLIKTNRKKGLAYYAFSAFIPQYAKAKFPDMASSDASLIISLVGVGNIISRLLVSVITMVIQDSPLVIFLLALFACGIVDIAVTLCHTVGDLLINGAFYSLVMGAWTGVYSLVLVKQFGIKNLPTVMGTFLMIQGIGLTSGPPLLSYIGTVTNPESIFYAAGSFLIICVIVMLPLIFNKKLFVPGRRKSVTLKVFTVT